MAADLRFVVAVLKINNDLERMGDLARNIAKRVAYLASHGALNCPPNSVAWPRKAQSMVRRSLDALVNRDTLIARQIRDDDDEVDAVQRIIRDRIQNQMRQAPTNSTCTCVCCRSRATWNAWPTWRRTWPRT